MFITSDKRDRELIQEKEGQCVTSVGVESRFARITLDRRMTMEVVRLLLGGICWRHIVRTFVFNRYTGKLWEHIIVDRRPVTDRADLHNPLVSVTSIAFSDTDGSFDTGERCNAASFDLSVDWSDAYAR